MERELGKKMPVSYQNIWGVFRELRKRKGPAFICEATKEGELM